MRLFRSGFTAVLRAPCAAMGPPGKTFPPPCVMGPESIMSQKANGSTEQPVQKELRWGCDWETADRICCRNRHYAEHSGYFMKTSFLKEESERMQGGGEMEFFDSVTGKRLFTAPRGRTWKEFVDESRAHGWPSFRDAEVDWDNVRCLDGGECVSLAGTHLGHNIPDRSGSRYCINLVSVAGRPQS
eukprot:TRINITY_DN488_c0_g1_i3.p1 TRINITY_DN488_c0_g1~~TRINITY_DN488_c0_g1_i3.p1  ORF type:complete len:186 (+),score=35.72 TRINITY_DN488_c0_g1_i3:31-588(+)